jgi:putative salt-induced outer membrane protein YdiY
MLIVLFFSNCPYIFADQVILKNGDRLTGKILKKDGEAIVIETESAGTVTILWTAVEKIISDQPLNIKLSDGQVIKGKVAVEDEKLEVETDSGSKVPIQKEQIETLRNEVEQQRLQAELNRLRNPGFFDLWSGSVDVGFNLTTGNSEALGFTLAARAVRATPRDRISLYANSVWTRETVRDVRRTTADTFLFGGRYDRNISPRLFLFGSGDFEHDSLAFLKFRAAVGGGLGFRAVRTERVQLELLGGADYDAEFFRLGFRRRSGELLFGNDLRWRITPRIQVTQRTRVHPNLNDIGRFRTTFQASMVTNLNSWLGWHVSFTNRFDNRPFGTAERNDLMLTTGFRVGFGNTR